jgi:hypothetical protein
VLWWWGGELPGTERQKKRRCGCHGAPLEIGFEQAFA